MEVCKKVSRVSFILPAEPLLALDLFNFPLLGRSWLLGENFLVERGQIGSQCLQGTLLEGRTQQNPDITDLDQVLNEILEKDLAWKTFGKTNKDPYLEQVDHGVDPVPTRVHVSPVSGVESFPDEETNALNDIEIITDGKSIF